MLPNGPEVVAAMFGCWFAGCVYVPINPRAATLELHSLLAAVRPAALISDASRDGGSIPVIVAHDLGWSTPRGPIAEAAHHEPDIALVQWTSGTTGSPEARSPAPQRFPEVARAGAEEAAR